MAQQRERGVFNFATPCNWRIPLSWHFRNEMAHYGYLDLRPCYGVRRFRISRWLNPDGVDNGAFDDAEPLRYCELDEFAQESWDGRMHPWERKSEKIDRMPEFHTRKETERHVIGTLDRIIVNGAKYDKICVVAPPYNGYPMVCLENNGKVTIL